MSRFRLGFYMGFPPVPVAARSKVWVCGFLLSGIAGSNRARGMDVFLCECRVLLGTGLCDGSITHPGELYRVQCV